MKLLPWSWRSARPRAARADVAELLAHRHADGLGGLEAGATFGDMPTDQFGIPVFDDAEQPDLAVVHGGDLGGVGRPHHIRRLGDDVALMRRLGARAGTMRRQQGMSTHDPQHPLARHPDGVDHPQPGPDLAVAFTGPWRAGEISADRRQEGRIRYRWLRPASLRLRRWPRGVIRLLAGGIEGRAGRSHALQTRATP